MDYFAYLRHYLEQQGVQCRLECKDLVLLPEKEHPLNMGAGYLFIIEADAPLEITGDDSFFCLSDAKTPIQTRLHKGTVSVHNHSANSLCHLTYIEAQPICHEHAR